MKKSEFKSGVKFIHPDYPRQVMLIVYDEHVGFSVEVDGIKSQWILVDIKHYSIQFSRTIGGISLTARIKFSDLTIVK